MQLYSGKVLIVISILKYLFFPFGPLIFSIPFPCINGSCVDESGNWGRGGLFDALAKLSANTPHAYERAHEFGDLHLGDLHLIPIDGEFSLSLAN